MLNHSWQNARQKSRHNAWLLLMPVVLGSLLYLSEASAEACSYREAIMALETGNAKRGLALMRMASRDGDLRAQQYLQEQDYVIERVEFVKVEQPVMTAGAVQK